MSPGTLTVDRAAPRGRITRDIARPVDEGDRGRLESFTFDTEPGAGSDRSQLGSDRLGRRLLWLVVLRPLLASLVIFGGLFVEASDPKGLPRDFALYLVGAIYALTATYLLARRIIVRWPWLVEAQLIIDVFTIASVVVLTGGFHSDFVALFVLPILAGSVLRLKKGGLIIAGYSAVLFGLIVASQYGIVIPSPELWGLTNARLALPSPRYAFYSVGLHTVAFLTVARLTGYLAESLHRSDLSLHRASTAIKDLQVYTQHVIDSMTGGLAATDSEGRLVMFNRAAEAITGLRGASVIGREAATVLQLPQELRVALESLVEAGRGRRLIYDFARRDGRSLELGLSAGPLVTSTGRGFLFTFQDVTDSRRAEREAELQKRLAAIGQMAAGIAHEIRNPLASMSGSMQVLRHELDLSIDQAQLFDIVQRESERLNVTIRDFLSYARPGEGQPAPMNVAMVVRDAGRLIANSPDCTAEHRIVVDAPADLQVEAVEPQMRQIVWNLATNGLRAMPRGGLLRLSVSRVRSEDGTALVAMTVADEGVGIAAADLDRIFQPFHGGFAKGAGLGLAIVHRIVTEHGGSIHVSSEPGTGTVIDVRLPERQRAEAAA
jgi:two-component system, NtrC family, sensor histidine kinase PilS